MSDRSRGFATRAVHAGGGPDPTTGARAVPIYPSSSSVSRTPPTLPACSHYRSTKPSTAGSWTPPWPRSTSGRLARRQDWAQSSTSSGQAPPFLTFAALTGE